MNLATGLFELEQTDLYLPDVLPIAVTYRTRDVENRPFGKGATHPLCDVPVVGAAGAGGGSHPARRGADSLRADDAGDRLRGCRLRAQGDGDDVGDADGLLQVGAWWRQTLDPQGPPGWDLRLKDGTVYQFGENAPLQAIKDRYGNTTRIEHANGQTGNVTRVVSPHGRWLAFSYDGSNRVTQVKDNIGRTVGYTYDASGRLWKVTDPLNQVTEYTYNTDHNLVTVKNRNGVVYVTNEYTTTADAPTPPGWVKKQTFADGGTYQFAYTVINGKSTQTDVTNPRGHVRRVTLNSDGYTLSDTRVPCADTSRNS